MTKITFRWVLITALCAAFAGGLWMAAPPSQAQGIGWSVNVYGNQSLSGPVLYSGSVPTVSYTWGAGAPVINGVNTGSLGVPADGFSVRFSTTAFFTAGNYRFNVQVDDGVRLYVDGILLINDWQALGFRTLQADYNFATDGNHAIVVEMFDATGDATIIASWAVSSGGVPGCVEGYTYSACPSGSVSGSSPAPSTGWPPDSGPSAICNDGWNSCSVNASGTCSDHGGVRTWCTSGTTGYTGVPWYGEFYNNPDLTAPPVFTNSYNPSGLNLNWGQDSPGGAVLADNFTAKFTRTLNVPSDLPEAVYIFYIKADDNFRFYVDTTLILDRWDTYAGQQMEQVEVTLLNGSHTLRLEYREQTAGAFVFLTWTPPSAQNPVLAPDAAPGGAGGGAPTGITATVNVSRLNFRSAPSLSAQVLAKLSSGASYPVTGRTADNAWVQITVEGQTGWVAAQYVTLSGDLNTVPVVDGQGGGPAAPPPPPQPTGIRGMVMGNLRLREGPSARTPKIGLMPWGTEVEVYGKDQGHTWYKVNYDGLIGWAYAPWIRLLNGEFGALPYVDGSQPVYPPPPPTEGVIVQAYGNMRIRSGPGFQYPKIGKAVWGTKVQVLGISPDRRWYKIKYGDLIGWSYQSWYRPVQGDIGAVPTVSQ
jgi:uncharacterized protein YraI